MQAALLIKLLIPEPERGRFDARPAGASAVAPRAGEVEVRVSDTGTGIAPEISHEPSGR